MAVEFKRGDQVLTACLSGELDHHTAQQLREQVDTAAEQMAPRQLRLDFREVTFMDSSGVGLVMGRYRLMRLLGGTLTVCRANERVRRMMQMAGLDKLDIWEEDM